MRATAAAASIALVVAAVPGIAAAEETPEYAGANSVAIPYLGEAKVSPAEGWVFTDCGAVLAATALATACEAGTITFTSSAYDPELGTLIVPVAISNGALALTIDYHVRLAPPPAPSLEDQRYGYPFVAGSRVLIPFSDLDIECTVCTGGMSLVIDSVSPRRAGTAAVTGTHIVFSARAGFTGAAEVGVIVLDDLGQESNAAVLELGFTAPGESTLLATHVFHPLEAGAVTAIDLTELSHASGDESVELIGCGSAVHGTVVCSPDGTAEYHPITAAAVDQFSFHVYSESGEQSTGSVTLVSAPAPSDGTQSDATPTGATEPDAALPTSGFVPSSRAGREGPPSPLVPRTPPPEGTTADTPGLFDSFVRLLDRVGA